MIDTFLQPLVDDLRELASDGVPAVRWEGDSLVKFSMKAHVIVVSGDMPAISKVSRSVRQVFFAVSCMTFRPCLGDAFQGYQ